MAEEPFRMTGIAADVATRPLSWLTMPGSIVSRYPLLQRNSFGISRMVQYQFRCKYTATTRFDACALRRSMHIFAIDCNQICGIE